MSHENVDVFQRFIDAWQVNVDVLRRFIDAFNGRDLIALLDCSDPDIEVASGRVLIGTPTYCGHEGMGQLFRDVAIAWEELRSEPCENVVAVGGDALVVVADTVGKGKTTGAPFVAHSMAAHFQFIHGKVARCEFFANEQEALEAAGLRE